MKIATSQVAMQAASHQFTAVQRTESLNINRQLPLVRLTQDRADISAQLRSLNSVAAQAQQAQPNDDSTITLELSDRDRQRLELLQRMMEQLTGKKFKFVIPEKLTLEDSSVPVIRLQLPANGSVRPALSMQYDFSQTVVERQSMQFAAQGVVTTADGRTITFDTQLNMSREFVSHTELHLHIGTAQAADPLVINFAGGAPSLGERNFRFDLDLDSQADQIAFVGQGSGFLALDKNGDGAINDGSELFGPNSGNGFADLAAYDGDGNGWIDENDAIYDKLRIWAVDEAGNKTLFALGHKGVGAIFLGNVRADFDLKDSANATLGTVRATGVFLREDGTAGTVQHIDLTL